MAGGCVDRAIDTKLPFRRRVGIRCASLALLLFFFFCTTRHPGQPATHLDFDEFTECSRPDERTWPPTESVVSSGPVSGCVLSTHGCGKRGPAQTSGLRRTQEIQYVLATDSAPITQSCGVRLQQCRRAVWGARIFQPCWQCQSAESKPHGAVWYCHQRAGLLCKI